MNKFLIRLSSTGQVLDYFEYMEDLVFEDTEENIFRTITLDSLDNLINYKYNITLQKWEQYSEAGKLLFNSNKDTARYSWDALNEQWIDKRNLALVKTDLKRNLKSKRENIINSTITYNSNSFDTDELSQTRLLGLYISSQNNPEIFPVMWRTADNSWAELNVQDAVNIWALLQNHIKTTFDAYKVHEENINNLTEEETAKNYNIETNWS